MKRFVYALSSYSSSLLDVLYLLVQSCLLLFQVSNCVQGYHRSMLLGKCQHFFTFKLCLESYKQIKVNELLFGCVCVCIIFIV